MADGALKFLLVPYKAPWTLLPSARTHGISIQDVNVPPISSTAILLRHKGDHRVHGVRIQFNTVGVMVSKDVYGQIPQWPSASPDKYQETGSYFPGHTVLP